MGELGEGLREILVFQKAKLDILMNQFDDNLLSSRMIKSSISCRVDIVAKEAQLHYKISAAS